MTVEVAALKILRGKLVKESLWAFLSKGTAFCAFYGLQIFLVRSLTVEQWGMWSFFFSVLSIILLVSDFGLNLASKKFIAQYQHAPELTSVLRQSLFLRLITSLLFAAALTVGHHSVVTAVGRPELAPLFLCLPLVVFFYSVLDYFKTCSEGFHRLRFHFLLSSIEHWGKFLFLIAMFTVYGTLGSLVRGLALAYAIGCCAGLLLLWRWFFPLQKKGILFPLTGQILKYALPMLIMLVVAFGTLEVDTIMLNYLRGDRETGIYSAAKQLVYYIPHVTLALTMGTMPVFARIPPGKGEEYRMRFERIQKINTRLILSILLMIGTASPVLIPYLYGSEYHAAVPSLLCLLPYVFFVSHALCSGALLDYRGRAGRRAVHLVATFLANLVLNYLMIPRWGAHGAAIATSMAYAPYFLLNAISARRELQRE